MKTTIFLHRLTRATVCRLIPGVKPGDTSNHHPARLPNERLAPPIGFRKPTADAKNLPRTRVTCWLSKPTPNASQNHFLATGSAIAKPTKDTKRNFAAIVTEMESRQFIALLPPDQRFTKSQGRWRVRIEPHARHDDAANKAAKAPIPNSEPKAFVTKYLSHRFAEVDRTPTAKEIECARRLLAKASLPRLLELTPAVATAVRSRNANDLYFSFAERFYEDALTANEQAQREEGKRREASTLLAARSEVVAVDWQAKQERRSRLLTDWRRSTAQQQGSCIDRALGRDTSRAYRERILHSSIEKPAPEVLGELESLLLAAQAA